MGEAYTRVSRHVGLWEIPLTTSEESPKTAAAALAALPEPQI